MKLATKLLLAVVLSAVGIRPVEAQSQQELEQFTPFVRASQQVRIDGRNPRVDFIVRNNVPFLGFSRGRRRTEVSLLRGPDELLLLLADRRFEPLWAAITEWGGPGLEHAAAQSVELARLLYNFGGSVAPSTTGQSSARSSTRGLLQYATALQNAGRTAEAEALLRDALAGPPAASAAEQVESAMMRLQLVAGYRLSGDTEAELSELIRGEEALRDTDFAVNFTVNRAARLAEIGRYAEAFEAIEMARADFDTTEQGDAVPGSNRQFDWIHACALNGLGRTEEAASLMESVYSAREPSDRVFVTDSNFQVRMRAHLCMRNREGAVRELLASMQDEDALVSNAWVFLQPGLQSVSTSQSELLAEVRQNPRIIAATENRMRELPSELVPALNHWVSSRKSSAQELRLQESPTP